MTEIEFLNKEEERFRSCLEMHENSTEKLKEELNAIQKMRVLLQGQLNVVEVQETADFPFELSMADDENGVQCFYGFGGEI